MKKTLAVLLSVLMVISTITCMFTVTTAQAEALSGELIQNGDFENLTLNPVGENTGAVRGTKDLSTLLNGKWLRATYGLSYATYGDLTDYNAETDEVTKATATDYAKYFTACTTVIAQPDNQANHIGRANQTLFQGIRFNADEETFVYKMKVRGNDATTKFTIGFEGLQTTDGATPIDSFYDKYNLEVVKQLGNFTTAKSGGKIYVTLTNPNEWTDVEIIFKATKVVDAVPTNAQYSILDIDFTMFHLYHDSATLSSGDNGKNYRKNGMYYDDISLKAYVNPFGKGEFYKDGKKLENTNEYGGAKYTVNGEKALSIGLGDTVVATPDYNEDANVFVGWYKNNELVTREKEITFTVNSTDLYVPKFINKNLLENSASYEGYANGTSLFTTDMTRYPNEGEWGESTTTGYFKATVEEVIYDKYGYAYQQTKNGERAKHGASAKITNQKAYKGSNSLLLTGSYATTLTAFDVEPHTNYTVTFYALTTDASLKMKYSGITTTVNVAFNLVPTALDGGTLASSMSVALGNMGDAYALSKHSALTMSDTEWTKVTHTFNSGSFNKVYFCVCPSAGEKYYIDELSLVAEEKAETVDVKLVDANGDAVAEDVAANAIVSATVEKDIYTGTKTASVNYETGAYTFLGWYNAEGELVSSTKEFIVTGSLEGVYAKVQNNNLLTSAASYESYANNTSLKYTGTDYPSGIYFGGNKNDGYLGMTFEETIYDNKGNEIQQTAGGTLSTNSVTANVSNKYAHSGYNSVYIKNSFWTASMGIDVKPNTNYALSYYILAPAYTDANNVMALSAIATTVNTGAKGTGATAPLNSATTLYLASKTITSLHDGENWVKVTHSFNSMNLSKVYLVLGQTAVGKNPSAESYIDDLTLIETTPTTMDVEMKNCASIDPVDASLDALYIGQEFTFKVIDNMDTDAVVTFNGEAVTANVDGTYTVVLAEENALSVRFAGDENLPNYDEDEFGRKLNVNNLDVYSEPIWNGDTVYHETALFTPDKDTVKLLYPVDEIVSLRSYDLMTNYIEGYDFEITEDGMIKRLEGGRIPVWATSLTTDTPNDWPTTDGKYVVLTGDQTYPKFAISVTYKHSTTFADGYQPSAPDTMEAAINNTLNKLAKGEEVNIVIYGDSISCGWSSSGMTPDIKIYDETNTEGNYITRYNINVAPYAPTWVQMLEARLKELYPDATINFKNLSLGGKSSPWGAENIAARLALWKDEEGNQVVPDLMLIGFGVNDSAAGTNGIAVDEFKANMKAIVDNAREFTDNMNMEALYYSPMFPNQSSTEWPAERLLAYEAALEDLYLNDDNIGIVKLSSIFNEIIKSKNCEDYLNTNLNHGNDFTARLYYTSIMQAMTKPEDDLITPDAPAAPVAEKVTANSVTLVATEGYEYSKDGYCWQDSNVFEGLEANTEYTFYQRIASTDEAYTSEISKALTVTTPDAWVGIMGDANGDGTVNLKDLVTLARFVANWEGIEESPAMDLDGDGEIDLDDVTYLSKYLAGWPDYTI